MFHWENQQIAIFPPDNSSGIFSGSAVVDVNNTSGFFPNQDNGVVAIYTLDTPAKEVQEIAYSLDGGFTFITYSGNPVIDSDTKNFRDPKVIWFEGHWVMTVSYATEATIAFFTSPNLIDWTHASNFTHSDPSGGSFECPNMVELPVEGTNETLHVLTIGNNPGGPLGGSTTEYFVGNFNGTHFTPVDSNAAPRFIDFAQDNYAGQFYYGLPVTEDGIFIAWAMNADYAGDAPTADENWRSPMSLARSASFRSVTGVGMSLIQSPHDLSPVLGAQLASNDSLVNGSLAVDFSGVPSNALYLEANVTGLPIDTAAGILNITISSPASGESLTGSAAFAGSNATFTVDRSHVGGISNPSFATTFTNNQSLDISGTWSVAAVIDRSILEVFIDRGAYVATVDFYPAEPMAQLIIGTNGVPQGVQVSVGVWALQSAWVQFEDADGIVVGNVTTQAAP